MYIEYRYRPQPSTHFSIILKENYNQCGAHRLVDLPGNNPDLDINNEKSNNKIKFIIIRRILILCNSYNSVFFSPFCIHILAIRINDKAYISHLTKKGYKLFTFVFYSLILLRCSYNVCAYINTSITNLCIYSQASNM